MQIKARYSHLNGEEYLLVHRKKLWEEIQHVITRVDASACRTKVSKEKTMRGRLLYSPSEMNQAFRDGFRAHHWEERRTAYTEQCLAPTLRCGDGQCVEPQGRWCS